MNHPVENRLRPPVELSASAVSLGCAALPLIAPDFLMLVPAVGAACTVLLGAHGLWWGYQGWAVLRYQRHLVKPPLLRMNRQQIPAGSDLFLGQGFLWCEKHTQRLVDTRRARNARYVRRLTDAAGGDVCLHGVGVLEEQAVVIPDGDRNAHTLVLGTTRVGKTRLLEIMATQDIRRPGAVVIIDPKGDAELLARVYYEAEQAGKHFLCFHLGYPESSARYNGIGEFTRITEVATRISNQLSGEGNSAAFKQFAWRFVNIITKAVVELGATPDYVAILTHVTSIDPLFVRYGLHLLGDNPAFMTRYAEQLASDAAPPKWLTGRSNEAIAMELALEGMPIKCEILDGLRSAIKYDRTYFDKIVASLLPLLEKLTSGKAGALLSPDYRDPDDNRPLLDWRTVVTTGAVVYVGLDALADNAVATAVGNTMLADLTSYAGSRYLHGDQMGARTGARQDNLPLNLYLDEFAEIAGQESVPMFNKAGGAGFRITAFTQVLSDIEARMGSRARALQLIGNMNNLICLRVKDIETARLLTDQLPEASVHDVTVVSSASDSSDPDSSVDFTSRSESRISTRTVPLVAPGDVMALPKGSCFALLQGGQCYKIRLPLPVVTDEPGGRAVIDALHHG